MNADDQKRLVVARALKGSEQLPVEQSADLYAGIALILSGKEADNAKFIAFSLREMVGCQLTFIKQLGLEESQ